MNKDSRIYIAGHRGLVGSAIYRALQKSGYTQLLVRPSSELDLRNQQEVEEFFAIEKPEYVFLAAAKVGGIIANKENPATFIYDNLCIQNNVIHQAYVNKVKKLLFLGSSCIYPKQSSQPIKEEYLLSGYLEPTNDAYAIAKIAGIKMCQSYHAQYGCSFISAMPTNLYGPGDNYDLRNSHVLPALLKKFHDAKCNGDQQVVVWGSGNPRREFLHADDAAAACLFLMKNYDSPEIINVGVGRDISISELALLIKGIVGYEGEIVFDSSKPDGTFQKLLDVSRINSLGWQANINLEAGIGSVYEEWRNELG
ncbi:MAG: GDP-L-fucose synthase [Bacteroidetes bacterium]|nr:GDP-L-fucose synthase [Bacteroidota bacterium]